jgi:hypothetical protein
LPSVLIALKDSTVSLAIEKRFPLLAALNVTERPEQCSGAERGQGHGCAVKALAVRTKHVQIGGK